MGREPDGGCGELARGSVAWRRFPSRPLRAIRRLNLARSWREDFETARSDLEATKVQATLVATNAFTWRLSALLLPAAILVTGVLVPLGGQRPIAGLLVILASFLGPPLLAGLLTYPLAFFAAIQTWYSGSHEARIRFGTNGFVFSYYGWRYAFRGRTRPWGALSREERERLDPQRAGSRPGSP
jgi:fumarate reductase subunit D